MVILNENNFLGKIDKCYLSYACDSSIRFSASSGGFCKSFLCFLLDIGEIDQVVTTRIKADDPLESETIITSDKSEIISSKTNTIYNKTNPLSLLHSLDADTRYAIVGLPCHITGFRKYCDKIKIQSIFISLLCNHTPMKDRYIQSILDFVKLQKDDIKYIEYRGRGWSGSVYLKDNFGKDYILPHQEVWSNYIKKWFNPMKKCKQCLDVSGIYSDVSVGDAWISSIQKSDKVGTNLLISRNKKTTDLINKAQHNGYIVTDDIDNKKVYLTEIGLFRKRQSFQKQNIQRG